MRDGDWVRAVQTGLAFLLLVGVGAEARPDLGLPPVSVPTCALLLGSLMLADWIARMEG